MTKARKFRLASANVYSQRFDDETVVIDTVSGVYYSLTGSAVDIWSLIEQGAGTDQIVDILVDRYDETPPAIASSASNFLQDLLGEGLIREADAIGLAARDRQASATKAAFQPPVIQRFTDMQNLLLLDPIHDVSDEGWPRPQAAS